MDQRPLVGSQIRSAYRLAQRFLTDGHNLTTAFWLHDAEAERWSFYLVTPLVDDQGPAATYQAIYQSFEKLPRAQQLHLEIRAISPTNPVARDVQEFMNFNFTEVALSAGLGMGTLVRDDLHVYFQSGFDEQVLDNQGRGDVEQEILQLMKRGAGEEQPQIYLKDGTHFNGFPFSIERGPEMSMIARFVVEQEFAPRVVRLDEITSIL